MNQAIITGRLGQKPELKALQTEGEFVCTFTVATNGWSKNGQTTEWHNVAVFGKQAKNAEKFLDKGSLVGVIGRMQTRKWDDENGNKRNKTQIVASAVEFMDTKKTTTNESEVHPGVENHAPTFDDTDDFPV